MSKQPPQQPEGEPDGEQARQQPNGERARQQPDRERASKASGGAIDRRTLLKSGLLAGGALAGGGAALADLISKPNSDPATARATASAGVARHHHQSPHAEDQSTSGKQPGPPPGFQAPNILVVMVDQLRTPQWFSATPEALAAMPNLARLRNGAVSFENHYTAANDCTPARAALLTGLHTHQTGCMITGGSTLDPGFPTWGTMLRELGYRTYWYGKWHLTHGDNLWDSYENAGALEPYGFAGGTFPSPDGAPGQGWRVDPHIVSQFETWFAREGAGGQAKQPWCTTVSLVNPHDIAWWYHWSDRFASEAMAPSMVGELPPNFETPEEMLARGKPQLQRSLQDTAQASFGKVPYDGPDLETTWLPFLDLYLKLLGEVDSHIGSVLNTLASRPDVAANTVIVFTSDHGEYGASHGMRGKGGGAYEEAIRVPLIVRDLREKVTVAPAQPRTGLTSSVDVAPLMLDLATGASTWRQDNHYSYLASRHDVASMLSDPTAPGRDYVLHATDETVTEFAIEPYAAEAPLHVVALRTPAAKYATYSNFAPGSLNAETAGRESELYDYSTPEGRMELANEVGNSALEPHLAALMQRAVRDELHEPLPQRLHRARRHGLRDYFRTAARAAERATERRRERAEREFAEEAPFSQEPDFSGSEANATSLRREGRRGRAGARRRHKRRAG